MPLISAKLFSVFLARKVIYPWFPVIYTLCEYLLTDLLADKYFIHNSLFWCKINKFISFFGKKAWKTYVKPCNLCLKFTFSLVG